jgi:hypothetical protein
MHYGVDYFLLWSICPDFNSKVGKGTEDLRLTELSFRIKMYEKHKTFDIDLELITHLFQVPLDEIPQEVI